MDEPVVLPAENLLNNLQQSDHRCSVPEAEGVRPMEPSVRVTSKSLLPASSARKKLEPTTGSKTSSNLTKPTVSSSVRVSNSMPAARRNSTGGVEKASSKQSNHADTVLGKNTSASSAVNPLRRSLPELRSTSLTPMASKSKSRTSLPETRKSVPAPLSGRGLARSVSSAMSKPELAKKSSVKPASPASSSSRKIGYSSAESGGSIGTRKSVSKVSSPLTGSPAVSSTLRTRSVSSSLERSSSLSGRKKIANPENRNSRLLSLPHVESKAGDDVRLDLRGHRIRSLNANGLNLSANLEFVYLRDNILSTLEGVEILKQVKVLDLSFNNFKGPGFEPLENCKVLQQLYLAGNQILSLASLPELPNLEFLSVAQNKLKSLSMATQPRLQVLAASKNKISTLKGFPHLPALEHLRIEDNPILKTPHLEAATILLVGPTLKKFNDRDLSRGEILISKRYPPHTALCIRDGWEFCRSERAAESTFHFLVEQWKDQLPNGYLLKEASVDKPSEEEPCHCHFSFSEEGTLGAHSRLKLKYQWLMADRMLADFTIVPDATEWVYWPKHEDVGKILKVECTPVVEEIECHPIFAISSPVVRGSGIPKVVEIEVTGELVEGNIIKGQTRIAWCGGIPSKGVVRWLRKKWNSSPVVVPGAEDDVYQLTLDDVDSSVVFMYTPVTEDGVKGEPQYKYTDFVKAASPSVSNVQIIGDTVEGNTIQGVGEYFGGREGPSKFQWLREDKETGHFVLISTGASEYTLNKEDVGRSIAFVYVPINFEGLEGESVSVVSNIVKQAPPKVTGVKINGDLRENSKVTVTGLVTGGTESSSRVQWFKTSSPMLESKVDLEPLSSSKVAKAFRIPLGAVGHYIVVKYTPMTPDGESGDPAYSITESAVETLPPSLNFLSITGDYIEGGLLTASYGYLGGHEGKSLYRWFLHEAENDPGVLLSESCGLIQYNITKRVIGKFVSFQCIPVRDDGMVGEARSCIGQERVRAGSPKFLSLQIMGNAVEGKKLVVNREYWGGEEGNSVFRWFRTNSDGMQKEVVGASSSEYLLSVEDIGLFISVSCEPVRNDQARGPIVLSELIGPIVAGLPTCHSLEFLGLLIERQRLSFVASYSGGEKGNCGQEWYRVEKDGTKERLGNDEFLDLTLADVGKRIELVYIPARKDGLKGSPISIMSDMVAPADPMGLELVIPDPHEQNEIIPQKVYFGGEQGIGEYIWYRVKNKLHVSELLDMPNTTENATICCHTFTYTPSVEDVGASLALYWQPTRADGKCGKPLVAISNSQVAAAFPLVSKVQVKMLSADTYSGEGEYFGGHEGSSLFSWYREGNNAAMSLINGANNRTYKVTEEDYNCRLFFGYTPVRSDSVVGELKLSEPTEIILPELPRVETLALTGKPVEGEVLTAVEVIPNSEIQQRVWSKYKKNVSYQWFCSSESGGETVYEPFQSQKSCSYRVKFEDIGRHLRCECVVNDVFGRSSEPAYTVTAPIMPGFPRIDKLEIEGRGFHTNLYVVRGIYNGGKEGKSRVTWLRSMVGSPDLISIPGETRRMYESNVDDVGYRLVVVYTPVREDGIEGHPVSASTEPIAVEPDIYNDVKQKIDLGSVKFEVLCDKEPYPRKVPGEGNLDRRILEINRKRVKVTKPGFRSPFPTSEIRGTYSPPFHVETFRNDQRRLRIVVDSENEVDLLVHSRHLRDVIVLVLRGLAQRFNSTSLNSLLKIDS